MSAEQFLGIDLGTTNSVAVLLGGDRATPVRTADGGALLPSVVRFDGRGKVAVGARARRFLDEDPDNTRSEFKRLMGSGRRLAFPAAKLEKTPEELSALVLSTLRTNAERALGFAPDAAVVTVPALFELPQTRATSEAARLAGFSRVEHLQEPVASALTAGWNRGEDAAPWLVYDLGGGTFDVSLLETREGVLRVVDHDGDNFLGGRDMDSRLLDHVLGKLAEVHGRAFSRSDPAFTAALRRLRIACEDAKIDLAAGDDASVSLPDPIRVDGDEYEVDVPLRLKELDALVTPIVDRTVDICLRLLERQGLSPAGVARVVLVGGPTVMPVLRTRLHERLAIALALDVDPMTAVAEGAARFASERGLAARVAAAPAATAKGDTAAVRSVKAWLQYPSVSGDLFPFVVGRVEPRSIDKVRFEREDGAFRSTDETIGEDGSFVVQLELVARATTTFRLVASRAGEAVPVEPAAVTLRHGISLGDPLLSRTIGIALADGTVAVYFERGAPLPSRKTFRLRTSFTAHPGQQSSAISVPVVQGEAEFARLCRLVGRIDIRSEMLSAPLAAGSPVDVVLELDRGGRLTGTAHVPDQGVTFPGVLVLATPDATVDELREQVGRVRANVELLYADPSIAELGQKKLSAIDERLLDVDGELEAAAGGDLDALEKLRRLLIDMDARVGEVEALRTWPALESEALRVVSWAVHWVSRAGSDMERRTLEEAMRSLERARAVKSVSDYGKRLRTIERLGDAVVVRDEDGLRRLFDEATTRMGEMRDPRAGRQHVEEGRRALAANDTAGARKALYAAWKLLPPPEEVRAKAHGSGVER
ncbi:MAG TPA: Hsp70 family protein [Polyangiaceae bacterium]|jgi:molecular chaperone DnaK